MDFTEREFAQADQEEYVDIQLSFDDKAKADQSKTFIAYNRQQVSKVR